MRLSKAPRGLLVLLSMALAGCAAGESDAEEAPPPEPMSQAGANAMRDAYVLSFMSRNPAGMAAFYAPDAVVYMSDGSVFNGRPAIEAGFAQRMQEGYDSLGVVSTSFEASGDVAIDRGTFVLRQLDPQTKEVASRTNGGYMVEIRRQPDGTFQIVKDSAWAISTSR